MHWQKYLVARGRLEHTFWQMKTNMYVRVYLPMHMLVGQKWGLMSIGMGNRKNGMPAQHHVSPDIDVHGAG
jgi:hypothetical protein